MGTNGAHTDSEEITSQAMVGQSMYLVKGHVYILLLSSALLSIWEQINYIGYQTYRSQLYSTSVSTGSPPFSLC